MTTDLTRAFNALLAKMGTGGAKQLSTTGIERPGSWRILGPLSISGFLLALPGGLLPLWGYHIRPNFHAAAFYFAILGIGLAAGAAGALRFRDRWPTGRMLAAGGFGASVSLVMVATAAPPASFWYQLLAVLACGLSAGVVNTAVFESLGEVWGTDPAKITLNACIIFGSGSVYSAWILSRCMESENPVRLLGLTAALPAAAGWLFLRQRFSPHERKALPVAEAVKDLRSVLAILFALLLFFQFANEWSIAGWLPVYLIDRLGFSPESAVALLAMYWLSLTAGRVAATWLLARVSHGKMLGISAFCALFGCVALSSADTRGGVVVGILLIGVGFSAIYPLSAERIATRFEYYHPGYFNGIFTFAMLGGIVAPFVLGHLAVSEGLRIVPISVMAGSCAVFALVLLVWLGRKVSGS